MVFSKNTTAINYIKRTAFFKIEQDHFYNYNPFESVEMNFNSLKKASFISCKLLISSYLEPSFEKIFFV